MVIFKDAALIRSNKRVLAKAKESRPSECPPPCSNCEGKKAYETELKARPIYNDGTQRPPWEKLPSYIQENWKGN